MTRTEIAGLTLAILIGIIHGTLEAIYRLVIDPERASWTKP